MNAIAINSLELAPYVNIGAFLVCLLLAVRDARTAGLTPAAMYVAGVCGIIGALVGGHVAFAIFSSLGETPTQSSPPDFLHGGKAVMGAFVGAALFSCLYLHLRRLASIDYAAAALPAIAMGYSTARMGCFLNGDDFGILTAMPWAVRFPPGTEAFSAHLQRGWIESGASASLPVHPVQLYHAALGIGLFLLLRCMNERPGFKLTMAMTGYGAGRFLLQYLRDVRGTLILGLDVTQWLCLVLLFGGVAALYACRGPGRHDSARKDMSLAATQRHDKGRPECLMTQ